MAKAKKLPSGSWRVQVYDYTDQDSKRHYESFTANTKKEAEYLAAEFTINKKHRNKPMHFTVSEAIKDYIDNSDTILSPTTIQGYRTILDNSFQDIMNTPLKKITNELLQKTINEESKRLVKRRTKMPKTISAKTVRNSYGLLASVLNKYYPDLNCSVRLPAAEDKIKELLPPEIILDVVKNTSIELPVLLALWLSFSMSEIKGLKKSLSINEGYLTIKQVMVNINNVPVVKKQAKTKKRIRKHRIPDYIQQIIEQTDPKEDYLVPMSSSAIYHRFEQLLAKNNLPHMSFHDLRHVNASVMALLRVPDKYAMERGGWKTDAVMKRVYTHTFSEQRKEVDNMIDNYFNKCNTKYNAK